MDKFSEMSHAERVAYLASKVALAKSYDSPVLTVPIPDLEILLAELEASSLQCRGIEQERELFRLERTAHQLHARALEQRIAELERITEGVDQLAIDGGWTARGMSEYAKSLEQKLATPVQLQSPWEDNVGNRWLLEGTTADAIRAAGFTVEGDE